MWIRRKTNHADFSVGREGKVEQYMEWGLHISYKVFVVEKKVRERIEDSSAGNNAYGNVI